MICRLGAIHTPQKGCPVHSVTQLGDGGCHLVAVGPTMEAVEEGARDETSQGGGRKAARVIGSLAQTRPRNEPVVRRINPSLWPAGRTVVSEESDLQETRRSKTWGRRLRPCGRAWWAVGWPVNWAFPSPVRHPREQKQVAPMEHRTMRVLCYTVLYVHHTREDGERPHAQG